MSALLSIENLSVSFRQEKVLLEAVSNVSFSVFPGEITAIVGESGSGKSITALSILQLLPKEASFTGKINFLDPETQVPVELTGAKNKQIRKLRGDKIAMIFQEPMTSLNPLMRCGNQITEALRMHHKIGKKQAVKIAKEALLQAGIPVPENIFHRYPHQLSGGQKQRIMIAMAIICQPKLLIADEPTTALDVKVQQEILSTLVELKEKKGIAILLITHDLGVVADYADRIIVMRKGTIVEEGIKDEILKNPKHAYTQALLACRPAAHPKGIRLPQVADFMEGGPDKSNFPDKQTKETTRLASQPLIVVKDISVYRDERKNFQRSVFKAVDQVSFELCKNEITGLVGQSGCGKTTLGRALLNLIPVTSGSILVNGSEVAHSKGKQLIELRKELQIVFQDPYGSLNPRISIGDAIAEVMKVNGLNANGCSRKEKVAELLRKVDLKPDAYDRYPHQFSGGQRQRICIARALACEPSFIVFDEAVSALDVSVQAQVLNLINDLKNEFGFTALFISHDLALVRYISDKILIMKSGKIIETGSPEAIFSSPKSPYTQSLLDAIPGKSLAPFIKK